jgi:hypothetical protein
MLQPMPFAMLRIILRNHRRLLLAGLIAVSHLENARAAGVFPIAANPAAVEFAGGVAFDGTNYLVGMTSGTNVVGQSVSTAGKLVGSQFILGSNPGFPPAVAMAGGKANCLVAWSDYSISSGVNSFARLVSPSSGPLGSKFPLLASAGTHGLQAIQAAASDGTNFLVVWQDTANTTFYGQFGYDHPRPVF